MKVRTTIAALVFATIAAAPLLAQSGPRPHLVAGPEAVGPQAQPFGPLVKCLGVTDLSDAQKADVKAALEAAAPQLKTLHEQLAADRKAVRDALDAATPDACAVGRAVLEVEADRKEIRSALDSVRTKIEALLTAEQKLKLEGCIEGMRAPRGPGR